MGCYRTLDEIARWRQFDEAKKQAILDRLTRHKQDKIQMHDVSFEPYKPVL